MNNGVAIGLMACCLAVGWGAGWLSGNNILELQAVGWRTNASLLINDQGVPRTPSEGQALSAVGLIALTRSVAPGFDELDFETQESVKRYAIAIAPHVDILPTTMDGRDEAVAMIKCIAEPRDSDSSKIADCAKEITKKFSNGPANNGTWGEAGK